MEFQTPRGTRDFLPDEMIKRSDAILSIQSTFELWGFDPMQTPAFEEWNLLSAKGGEEIKNEIYYFKDKSERELGLRFDFTVPFSRVFVNNPNLPKPFKRYQIGPVWRYDRPGAGRYREFYQADIDIAGAATGESDALCISVICDTLKKLGIDNFHIRLNNRKIIESLLITLDLKDNVKDILRSIDKLDKFGEESVSKELKEKKIPQEKIAKIMTFIKTKNASDAKKYIKEESLGKEGFDELENILSYVEAFGFSEYVKFDLSLVRGLEYYTGPVFEINAGIDVSIGGGGRYDNLIEGFGGKSTPAVGISIGVDRVMLVLENINKEKRITNSKIYVVSVGNTKKECINICKELISYGINSEFDLTERAITKQLDYINSRGIPFAIVIGEKELGSKNAKLRDMKTGKEHDIHLKALHEIKKMI